MIPLPQGINADDLSQWLSGGICMVKLNEQFEPATMAGTADDGDLIVRLMRDNWTAHHTVPLANVRAHWPLCGSLNVPEYRCATHVERRPEKQYRRTFSSRLMQYNAPRGWDIGKKFGAHVERALRSSSTGVLKAIYYPEYPVDYDAALEMLSNGWFSVAVNPRIIVAGDDAGKRMIYYRGELAATLTGDEALSVTDELTTTLIDKATGGRYTWIKE